jgi:hypothetical protein
MASKRKRRETSTTVQRPQENVDRFRDLEKARTNRPVRPVRGSER